MRIVHLNPFYFPYAGGIERRIRATARRLARQHDVHIVTARQPGTEAGTTAEDGFAVHRLPSTFPLRRFYNPPLVRTRGLAAALASIRPDVVDFHFRWAPGYSKAFRDLEGTGRVATYHNTYGEGLGLLGAMSRLNDRLYMRTVRRADRVVCVSHRVHDDLQRRGVDPDRLRINHNAVEKGEIDRVTGAPTTDVPGRFVVAVGRVVALKGLDVLVRAWRSAPPDLHLVLVGKGPAEASLHRLAARLGVSSRVHFTGWVSEDEKIRLLKGAVAYAHPARFESFPLSILEAQAAGAPVVAARIGGIPEVVGDAGMLLDHDPAAWARQLSHLAEDASLRDGWAKASRRRSQAFDWDAITADLARVYDECLAR